MAVHYSVAHHIAQVTIDRPPVNALDDPTYAELTRVFSTADADDNVHVVVLRSTGERAFCGGTDVNFFSVRHPDDPQWHERHSSLVRDTFTSIYRCRVPVVAAVHAAAVGAGIGLLGSCDLVVAGERATFRLPEIDVDVLGGARHLARLLPTQLVRYMALTGEAMAATTLHAAGGACKLVPDDMLAEEVGRLAAVLRDKSPVALRAQKQGLNHLELNNLNVEEGYRYEQTLTGSIANHPYSREAAQAFLDKRTPSFVQG